MRMVLRILPTRAKTAKIPRIGRFVDDCLCFV